MPLQKEKSVDFVVVAPDDPLGAGMVDTLEAAGFPCFGPNAKAAEIESSKVFSKGLMKSMVFPRPNMRYLPMLETPSDT